MKYKAGTITCSLAKSTDNMDELCQASTDALGKFIADLSKENRPMRIVMIDYQHNPDGIKEAILNHDPALSCFEETFFYYYMKKCPKLLDRDFLIDSLEIASYPYCDEIKDQPFEGFFIVNNLVKASDNGNKASTMKLLDDLEDVAKEKNWAGIVMLYETPED